MVARNLAFLRLAIHRLDEAKRTKFLVIRVHRSPQTSCPDSRQGLRRWFGKPDPICKPSINGTKQFSAIDRLADMVIHARSEEACDLLSVDVCCQSDDQAGLLFSIWTIDPGHLNVLTEEVARFSTALMACAPSLTTSTEWPAASSTALMIS